MDKKTLAGQGLQVHCIDRTSVVPAGDQAWCLNPLQQRVLLPWRGQLDPAAQDHVVMVYQHRTGRLLGMLTASKRHTGHEPFLLLEAAYVAPQARGHNLLQRMAAVVLLSVARFEWKPAAVIACTRHDRAAENLLRLRTHIGSSAVFPAAEANVIDLVAAGIARRAARVMHPWSHYAASSGRLLSDCQLLVLALDMAHEAHITTGARRLYQRRPTRQAVAMEFVPGSAPPVMPAQRTPLGGSML